ncbi:MAG: thiol oxidoreductase [Planctomycetota bacterium JB042]
MSGPSSILRAAAALAAAGLLASTGAAQEIGSEKAVPVHLVDGEEVAVPLGELLKHGEHLFRAKWTVQDGMGRPQLKGVGSPLSDPTDPLVFPRNFNRLSSPEATSCAGCHADPRPGGGGEFFTNAFVLAERFDYATFDVADPVFTKGMLDENGGVTTGDSIGNPRSTPALFGAGYVELLAREITADLRAQRNALGPNSFVDLKSKGISFGTLVRTVNGAWQTDGVEGLPPSSLESTGPTDPPSLVVQPFSHGAATVSIRQFTVGAYNHHIGLQAVERAGDGLDPDQDGIADELTRADVTAVTLFQAALAPPGRILPKSKEARQAVLSGEQVFVDIGCASCHVPCLPLESDLFLEPNPFNPAGTLQEGGAYHSQVGSVALDLGGKGLPRPRLKKGKKTGVIEVFVFSDFKRHDITSGPNDPNREPLDMLAEPGSPEFFGGNGTFLTPRLWGVGGGSPYFHHGKFTTLREAIEAHAGEASGVMLQWHALPGEIQAKVIEFLKSLQVLPEKAKGTVLNHKGKKTKWEPFPWTCGQDVPPLPTTPPED